MPYRDINKRREANKRYKKKYKITHREKYLAEKKRYKQKHKDKILEGNKRYYEKHKEELLEYQKEYCKTYPEKIRERRKNWKKTLKGKLDKLFGKHRRREKLRELLHNFSKEEWLFKVKATNGLCPKCKKPFTEKGHELTLDHNPPIAKAPKGFVYLIDNVNPLCRLCNSIKGDKI